MINLVIAILIVLAVVAILYAGEKAISDCNDYITGLEKKCEDLEERNNTLLEQLANEKELKQKIVDDNIALIEEIDALRERRY